LYKEEIQSSSNRDGKFCSPDPANDMERDRSMTKWEYMTLVARGGQTDANLLEVQKVDGVGIWETKYGDGKNTKPEHRSLSAFLARVGQEGWEIAGLSPIKADTYSAYYDIVVLLKRPIPALDT
jgi:hypothetical protein